MSESASQHDEAAGVERRIAKNTGLMFGGKGLGAVFNVLVLIVAGRALPPEAFGSLLLLHGYMLTSAELGSFKSWQALIRFGVPHLKSGHVERLHKLLRFCMGLDALMAFVSCLLALAFLQIGYTWIGLSESFLPIATAYCGLILFRHRAASLGALRLLDRFDLLALHSVVMPAMRFVGSLVVWGLGGGLTGFVLVWFTAALIDYSVLWAFAGRELHRQGLLKGLFSKWPTLKAPEPGLWPFCWTANIDSSLAVAKMELPLLLAGGVLGPAYAAVFKVAQQIASVLVKGTQQLDEVIYPELAKMVRSGAANRIWPLVIKTGALLVATALLVGGIVALAGPELLARLIRDEYRDSATLALLLLLAGALSAAYAPLLPTLYAAGRPARAMISRLAGVGTQLILFIVLARIIGPLGPGWAFIVGDSIALAFAVILTQRTLRDVIAQGDRLET